MSLRFRFFGLPVRIHATFLVADALLFLPWLQFQGIKDRWPVYLAIWLLCCFLAFFVHELGSALVARFFGARLTMVFQMLGGGTEGDLSALRFWQRILVHLAGPAFGFGLYGLTMWVISGRQIDADPFSRGLNFLRLLTFWYNLVSLLPFLPMNGGKVLEEILCLVSRRHGPRIAAGWSFLATLAVVGFAVSHWRDPWLELPWDLNAEPKFTAFLFGYFAVINLLALISYRPGPAPPREDSAEDDIAREERRIAGRY